MTTDLLFSQTGETILKAIKHRVIEELGALPMGQQDYEGSARTIAKGIIRKQLSLQSLEFPGMRSSEIHESICDDLFGLGCLEPLLRDDSVTDILVKGTEVLAVAGGIRTSHNRRFESKKETRRIIDRITGRVGKRIDAVTPFCDCQLYEGSRCHIIIPPAANDVFITVRKLKQLDLDISDWVSSGIMSDEAAEILTNAVVEKKNVIISGGTGAGKTTLLNTMANIIDEDQIIVTLEDTFELSIQKPHVRKLLTRQSSIEGVGEIRFSDLLKNALRMNPDRLIMGEVRDEAAYDLIHALNIGHKGSISTIHSNSVKDALWRLETLATMAVPNISLETIKRQITRVVDVVVQIHGIERGIKGYESRRVTDIAAVEDILASSGDYIITNLYVGAAI